MPRFAANLSWLFTELPLPERFRTAKAAGFEGAEILFPYDEPAAHLAECARLENLPIVLINAPPPNWTGGERGYAAIPGGEARFEKDFERALRFAEVLKAQHLHLMAGSAEGAEAKAAFLRNLRWAAARAPKQSLTIEPINRTDMPGYFLSDFREAMEIVAAVGAPNLGLQFDAYHAWMIHNDPMAMWELCAPSVRHIQIAGAPGRREPSDSEIDYPAFFRAVGASGYQGWISAEYRPRGRTEDGLSWLPAPEAQPLRAKRR
jgi:hydroxypyruvate isomerase